MACPPPPEPLRPLAGKDCAAPADRQAPRLAAASAREQVWEPVRGEPHGDAGSAWNVKLRSAIRQGGVSGCASASRHSPLATSSAARAAAGGVMAGNQDRAPRLERGPPPPGRGLLSSGPGSVAQPPAARSEPAGGRSPAMRSGRASRNPAWNGRRSNASRRAASALVTGRHWPGASPRRSRGGPPSMRSIATRSRRKVGSPTAAVIRRTCRLRPSRNSSSSQLVGMESRRRIGGSRSGQPGSSMLRTRAGLVRRPCTSTPDPSGFNRSASATPSTCT